MSADGADCSPCWLVVEAPKGNATRLLPILDLGGGFEGLKLNIGGSFQPGGYTKICIFR